MTGADYLNAIVEEQTLDPNGLEMEAIGREQNRVAQVLQAGLAEAAPRVENAGSVAKGTLILESYDLDLACYFRQDTSKVGDTLKDIYESVQTALSSAYKLTPRRSALTLRGRRDGTSMPFAVDVVPGRFVDEAQEDVFLFQTEGGKDRLKTNLRKHVHHVGDSGLVDVIKLAKLWRYRAGLELKTFLLELLVIEILGGRQTETHDKNLTRLWTVLRDDIEGIKIEDPANPAGNDLSSIFGEVEREGLSAAASVALDALEQCGWQDVYGPLEGEEGESAAELVVLDDSSHQRPPRWPVRPTIYRVDVTCSYQTRRGAWSQELQSGRVLVTDGAWFRYRACTNVPEPYEVFWQVVNTGTHAREEDCLRGDKFFTSRYKNRQLSAKPLDTWERSEYTGRHWIECFVVKGGELWARSGPFYVNIVNRRRRGYSGWIKRGRRGRRFR
ncbi:MAG: hypothetical protein O7H41_03025 [Planctomycetota bacterium]|nr:hypothetical protein [Planctomycetota bacterium]